MQGWGAEGEDNHQPELYFMNPPRYKRSWKRQSRARQLLHSNNSMKEEYKSLMNT